MNDDSKQLLNDVLGEAASADFCEALLNRTLSQVQKHRHARAVRRRLASAALLIALPLLLWKLALTPTPAKRQARISPPRPISYTPVQSQPISAAMLIRTKPGTTPTVTTSPARLAVIETRPGEHLFNPITDDELLRLFAGRSVALVRRGPGQAELLLLDSE